MAGDKRAVIVGINEYNDEHITNLEGAVNDAKEIRQRLEDCGKFKVEDSHFLTDKSATCDAIRKAVSDLLWQTDSHDIALFYFSGHGFVDSYRNGYIAPHNMLRNEPLVYGINMLELKRIVLNSVDSITLMILDCCHSGIPTKGDRAIPDVISAPYDSYFGNLDKEEGGEGKFIIASSEADQTAREISEAKHVQYCAERGQQHPHGAFTFCLIEGIDGEASDEAGIVNLADLFDKAKQRLKEMGKQEPKVFSADSSGMKAVKIAITSSKHNEYMNSELKKVKGFYENRDPASLIRATKIILHVLDVSPKNEEALDYQKKISGEYAEYRNSAEGWIPRNIAEVQAEIPKLFPKIEKLVDFLYCDNIINLDREQEALAIHLCRVSKGEIDIPTFIRYCKTFANRPDRAPAQTKRRSLSP